MDLTIDTSVAPNQARRRMPLATRPNPTTNHHRPPANIRRRRTVTNEQKRRIVIGLLLDEEHTKRSDGYLASLAGVSQPFVSNLRRDLSKKIVSVRAPKRRGSDGVLRNTTPIGKRRRANQEKRDLVHTAIHDQGAWTVKELMDDCDLTRPALQLILDDFLAAGVIITTRRNAKSSTGGRPELLYIPNPNYKPPQK